MTTNKAEMGFFIFFILFIITLCIMFVFIGKHNECSMVRDAYERTVVKIVKDCRKP